MSTNGAIGTPVDDGDLSLYTLTRAAILARVNQITGRQETSIDDLLYEVLTDLSRRTLFLADQTTGALDAGDTTIPVPLDMASPSVFGLVVNGVELPPISWHEYLSQARTGYVYHGQYLYLSPAIDQPTTYTLYYPRLHPKTSDPLLFPDRFGAAIQYGTAAKLYENYELYERADAMRIRYELEVRRLNTDSDTVAVVRPLSMRL